MRVFKGIKTWIRKVLFHPFGYDVVPLKKTILLEPGQPQEEKPAQSSRKGELDLSLYYRLYGQEAVRQRRFYNIGPGPNFAHPAWTRIDSPSDWYGTDHMHIAWDLLAFDPLPIEESSAHIVYSSYVLEHVTDGACQYFLGEANRVLVPGGFLRIVVPDIDIYYEAFQAGDREFFFKAKAEGATYPNEKYRSNPNQASLAQNFLWNFASAASELHADGAPERIADGELERVFSELSYGEALNYCTARCPLEIQKRYPGNHINWFNESKLARMLREAAFAEPYRSGYGQSRSPVLRDLRYFDHRNPEIGLYLEAIK